MIKKAKLQSKKTRKEIQITRSLSARISPSYFFKNSSIISSDSKTPKKIVKNNTKRILSPSKTLKKNISPKSTSPFHNLKNRESIFSEKKSKQLIFKPKNILLRQKSLVKDKTNYLSILKEKIKKIQEENKIFKKKIQQQKKNVWETVKMFKNKLQNRLKFNNLSSV